MLFRPGNIGHLGRLGLVTAMRNTYSPLSLFASGEQGVWYDPSDLSTLFQDAAGTIPVTGVGQPVGLMLDKSGRGNHATQSAANSRPILQQESSGQWYLACDGSDDGMATGNINFSSIDRITAHLGIRKLIDTTVGMVFELGNGATSNRFHLTAPGNNATANFNFLSQGVFSQSAGAAVTSYPAPITTVLTGEANISNDLVRMRVNGSVIATNTGDQGAGNYSNAPLYLFRRAGTSLPFSGRFYGLILRGATSTADQITRSEQWMAAKTGVTF